MKDRIIEYLQQHKSVKRADLLRHICALGYQITDRSLRAELESLITNDGYCIESSNLGYSLIKSFSQKERAKQYLTSKIEALCIRRNCIEKNYKEEIISNSQILLSL